MSLQDAAGIMWGGFPSPICLQILLAKGNKYPILVPLHKMVENWVAWAERYRQLPCPCVAKKKERKANCYVSAHHRL